MSKKSKYWWAGRVIRRSLQGFLAAALVLGMVYGERYHQFNTEGTLVQGQSQLTDYLDEYVQLASIAPSDGQFASLAKGWKETVRGRIANGSCDALDPIIREEVGESTAERLVIKALIAAESGCDNSARGKNGDTGVGQVRAVACKDVGVEGDPSDLRINIRCTVRYFRAVCTRYGHCPLADRLVAYNRGATGSQKVSKKESDRYVRRFGFALRLLKQREGYII